MGDLHEEAHHMYTKLMAYKQSKMGQLDDESHKHIQQQQQNIYALILQFLCVCPPTSRFKYGEIVRIISDSATMKTFDPEKARQAFLCLEDYIILLYLMPWKMEYHAIKKYGGHYQTKVASHIKGAEIILRLVGFTDLSTGLMILSHHTKPDVLQYIAFECLVASAECLILAQVWRKLDHEKLSMKEVVQIRLQQSGNADAVISVIESKFGSIKCDTKQKRNAGQGVETTDVRIHTSGSKFASTKFKNKLDEHIKKAEKISSSDQHHDIPYMDEDVKEIDRKPEPLEDHILASLQLVGDKEAAPAPCGTTNMAGQRASQEWSFVREGLEKIYSKRYFDGPREDILQQEEPNYGKDGGYVQVVAQPPYENVKNIVAPHSQKATKAVSPMPLAGYGNNSPSFPTVDSAYQSESMFYPPRTEENLIRRGHSDVIMRRETSPLETKKTLTAPLARRTISSSTTTLTASTTYPGSHRQTQDPFPVDNIMKYSKRIAPSSMPNQHTIPETREILPIDTGYDSSNNYKGNMTNIPVVGRKNYSMEVTGSNSGRDQVKSPSPYSLDTKASTKLYTARSSNQITVGSNVVSQVPVINRTKPTQWECTHCTFLNESPGSICTMCSKTRDTSMDTDGLVMGDILRICTKCTLENNPSSTVCTACGNELRSVTTVI